MQTRIVKRWHALRATFWFVPTPFATATVPLAFRLVGLEETAGTVAVRLTDDGGALATAV